MYFNKITYLSEPFIIKKKAVSVLLQTNITETNHDCVNEIHLRHIKNESVFVFQIQNWSHGGMIEASSFYMYGSVSANTIEQGCQT